MPEMVAQTIYFETPGEHNTGRTLDIARRRADELSIRSVLVATTRGETGLRVCRRPLRYGNPKLT